MIVRLNQSSPQILLLMINTFIGRVTLEIVLEILEPMNFRLEGRFFCSLLEPTLEHYKTQGLLSWCDKCELVVVLHPRGPASGEAKHTLHTVRYTHLAGHTDRYRQKTVSLPAPA